MRIVLLLLCCLPTACFSQGGNPFPPVDLTSDVVTVNYQDFSRIPFADGNAPRLMHMLSEPTTERLFVSTMTGKLYSISHDGSSVDEYLDLNAYGVAVMSAGRERGLQSFDFHPQFAETGSPGYGKFYTFVDVRAARVAADFSPASNDRSHDTVLLEWSAFEASSASYDGGEPRQLFRAAQPYGNHNAGEIAFNPLSTPAAEDYGLLYIGMADGGSGGDPQNLAQDMASVFGKILRLDPLGDTGRNAQYGIPDTNPFLATAGALPEIYALGVRNPQRFGWDSANGRMLVADIGQNQVEEISAVDAGANLGWNRWEGSYRHANRRINQRSPRAEPGLTWPLVEYDHNDPMLIGRAAISGVHVFRDATIPQLQNLMLFADIPSGELLYVPAAQEGGGQESIRRVLLNDDGQSKTLMQLIREENQRAGRRSPSRADLRFGTGPANELFLLNKADGVIRKIIP